MAAISETPADLPLTEETTELSKQYDTPMGLAHTTMQALKDRIKLHYDLASDYYLSLWYVPVQVHVSLFINAVPLSKHLPHDCSSF
jgi:hypothetical protein